MIYYENNSENINSLIFVLHVGNGLFLDLIAEFKSTRMDEILGIEKLSSQFLNH